MSLTGVANRTPVFVTLPCHTHLFYHTLLIVLKSAKSIFIKVPHKNVVPYFCNQLDGEEKAGCFTLTVYLMSCDNQCSVALPHGAFGWSAKQQVSIYRKYHNYTLQSNPLFLFTGLFLTRQNLNR